jgi:hypothetical protein
MWLDETLARLKVIHPLAFGNSRSDPLAKMGFEFMDAIERMDLVIREQGKALKNIAQQAAIIDDMEPALAGLIQHTIEALSDDAKAVIDALKSGE